MATHALMFGDFKGFWKLRARARITSPVWVLRYLSGVRSEGCAYSSYGKDEQRQQTEWIDAQTGEVILPGALTNGKAVSPFRETVL